LYCFFGKGIEVWGGFLFFLSFVFCLWGAPLALLVFGFGLFLTSSFDIRYSAFGILFGANMGVMWANTGVMWANMGVMWAGGRTRV